MARCLRRTGAERALIEAERVRQQQEQQRLIAYEVRIRTLHRAAEQSTLPFHHHNHQDHQDPPCSLDNGGAGEDERRVNPLEVLAGREGLTGLDAVKALLQAHPEDYWVSDWEHGNRSLLHAALLGGDKRLLHYLRPASVELDFTDRWGNAAIHFLAKGSAAAAASAAATDRLPLMRLLAAIAEPDADPTTVWESGDAKVSTGEGAASASRPQTGEVREPQPPQHILEGRPLSTAPPQGVSDDADLVEDGGSSAAFSKMQISGPCGVGVGGGVGGRIRESVFVRTHASDALAVIPGASAGTPLRSGWLSKRGESSTWRRRWVVLTGDSLMYFRQPKDRVPRDTLSFVKKNNIHIERSPLKATAIDIYIHDASQRKKRSRISLMAEHEQEIQVWMNLLKAVAGVESKPLRSAGDGSRPVRVVNPTICKALVSMQNRQRETALHMLCSLPCHPSGVVGNDSGSEFERQLLSAAAWLINRGCHVDSTTAAGKTALQLCNETGRLSLGMLLERYSTIYGLQTGSIIPPPVPAAALAALLDNSTTSDGSAAAPTAPAPVVVVCNPAFRDSLASRSVSAESAASTSTTTAGDSASALDLSNGTGSDGTAAAYFCFLPSPLRLRGFHYLSIEFLQHRIINHT